ncbi:elongation factor Ts [Salmonella enterica subsp. enterica serovar Daytona]|uniref:Elongation factor Ts n=1 Tax=Salmonella enterica subsp. enterica serovar Daytona TaxID=1962639 RepID=A0A447JN21_SALET|nr:elongation factor Ts [Salmonella enterica subsp. enterica serovar Daytona]
MAPFFTFISVRFDAGQIKSFEDFRMAEITASLVKELRERTGAGMMDCKKALTEANGDIELAIENMRKSGAIKAAKKAGNVAADGVIKTKIDGNVAFILEVNCQTDFVAKDAGFQAFADKVLDAAVAGKITDVEVLKAQFEEERVALVAKIGENINNSSRRFPGRRRSGFLPARCAHRRSGCR